MSDDGDVMGSRRVMEDNTTAHSRLSPSLFSSCSPSWCSSTPASSTSPLWWGLEVEGVEECCERREEEEGHRSRKVGSPRYRSTPLDRA